MTRHAPLSVAAGLFAAIALPLKAGSAAETEQAVDIWLAQHQTSLTQVLDKKLGDQAVGNVNAHHKNANIEPIRIQSDSIRVSTVAMKRIIADSAI